MHTPMHTDNDLYKWFVLVPTHIVKTVLCAEMNDQKEDGQMFANQSIRNM